MSAIGYATVPEAWQAGDETAAAQDTGELDGLESLGFSETQRLVWWDKDMPRVLSVLWTKGAGR